MKSNRGRCIAVSLGAAAGGLLAAAFLPMAIAAADEYVYLPDPSTFVAESPSLTGYTPISFPPFIEGQTGDIGFNVVDTTNGITRDDAMLGTTLVTQFLGGATETEFTESGLITTVPGALDIGSQVDVLQLAPGWGSELVISDLAGPLGFEDILFSPFGAFTLF